MPRRVTSSARLFRKQLEDRALVLPGAFNALTALQIERAGFSALYVSGAGLSASRGVPDIGVLSLTEVVSDATTIARSVSIPVIVDADTGFGPPIMVRRTVTEFEQAGLAGMQIEDQELPKKCGHLPGKQLISTRDMVGKIRAACEARRDPDFFLIVRTDARAVEGFSAAVRRALAYLEAGADAVFPEALESADEFRSFARQLAKTGATTPLVANMTEFGKTPYLTVRDFEELGYRLVLFPVTALRMAAHAVDRMLVEVRQHGTQRALLTQMQSRQQLYDLLRYDAQEQPVHTRLKGDDHAAR